MSISIVDNCGVFQCIIRLLVSRDLSWVDTEIVLDVVLRPVFYSTIYIINHTYFILKLFCISKEFAVYISDSHGFNIHYLIVLIIFWKHFSWFFLLFAEIQSSLNSFSFTFPQRKLIHNIYQLDVFIINWSLENEWSKYPAKLSIVS